MSTNWIEFQILDVSVVWKTHNIVILHCVCGVLLVVMVVVVAVLVVIVVVVVVNSLYRWRWRRGAALLQLALVVHERVQQRVGRPGMVAAGRLDERAGLRQLERRVG